MADLKKELTEAEKEIWRYLRPRLAIGLVVVLLAAIYIFWPH